MVQQEGDRFRKANRLRSWTKSAADALIRTIYYIPVLSLFSVRYIKWIFSTILTCVGLLSFAFPAVVAVGIYYYYDDMIRSVAGMYITALWIGLPITVVISASYALRVMLLKNINEMLKGINVLAIRYATQHLINSFVGLALVFIFSVGYFIIEHDYNVLVVPVIYSFLTLGYGSVVYMRSKRGLFGSNAMEACELIAYIFEAGSFIDGPPGLDRIYPGFQEKNKISVAEGTVSGGEHA